MQETRNETRTLAAALIAARNPKPTLVPPATRRCFNCREPRGTEALYCADCQRNFAEIEERRKGEAMTVRFLGVAAVIGLVIVLIAAFWHAR